MMLKKIIYVHYQRAIRDGSFVHTREFAKSFKKICDRKGIEFSVWPPEMVEGIEQEKSGFEKLKNALARYYLKDFKILLAQIRKYKEELARLKREMPDAVVTRFDSNTLSIIYASRKLGIPVICEFNAPDNEIIAAGYRRLGIFRRVFCNAFAIKKADAGFAVSSQIAEKISAASGRKVETICNGVDIKRFDPALNGNETRKKYSINQEDVVFGFVGSFAPWHGIDLLIDAFEKLLQKHQNIHLLLVGQVTQQWKDKLTRINEGDLKGKVTVSGFSPPEEIPALLAAMDIAVLPNSEDYCSPLKIFEYMAMEKAIIAVNTPPVADTLNNGTEALLFPRGSVEELQKKMDIFASDRQFSKAVGKKARERVTSEFTWDINAENVFQLVNTAIKNEGG